MHHISASYTSKQAEKDSEQGSTFNPSKVMQILDGIATRSLAKTTSRPRRATWATQIHEKEIGYYKKAFAETLEGGFAGEEFRGDL